MGIFSWFFGKKNKQSESPPQILPPGYDSVTIKGNEKYQLEMVGESYYQDALEEICGPRTDEAVEKTVVATMVWEDDNPKDNLAVRIDIEGKTVGISPGLMPDWFERQSQKRGMRGSPPVAMRSSGGVGSGEARQGPIWSPTRLPPV